MFMRLVQMNKCNGLPISKFHLLHKISCDPLERLLVQFLAIFYCGAYDKAERVALTIAIEGLNIFELRSDFYRIF